MTPIQPTANWIENVQTKLAHGKWRITESDVNLRLSWFPEHLNPTFPDWLKSDRGIDDDDISTEELDLRRQFWQEVQALIELVPEGTEEELADWQKGAPEGLKGAYLATNRKAKALSLWDRFGVPLRIKKNRIYRIWAPRDLLIAEPIISKINAQDFLVAVCEKTAEDSGEIHRLKNKLTNWQVLAGICFFILFLVLVNALSR